MKTSRPTQATVWNDPRWGWFVGPLPEAAAGEGRAIVGAERQRRRLDRARRDGGVDELDRFVGAATCLGRTASRDRTQSLERYCDWAAARSAGGMGRPPCLGSTPMRWA